MTSEDIKNLTPAPYIFKEVEFTLSDGTIKKAYTIELMHGIDFPVKTDMTIEDYKKLIFNPLMNHLNASILKTVSEYIKN